jgi:hypothetical protein
VNLRFATGTAKKFADLQLRNEPKNLRICDLTKKICNSRDTSKVPATKGVPATVRKQAQAGTFTFAEKENRQRQGGNLLFI